MAEILNLNTRLGLKIDTLENWSKAENQFKLLNGEVAIATVAATAGNGLAEPVTMIKIGDGTKTFNELPWAFYAKAADVYGWAKKEHPDWADFSVIPEDKLPTVGIDTDTKYAFEITTEGKLKVTSTTYTKGVAGATTEVGQYDFVTPAELETALANYYTKGEVDGLLAGYAPLAAFNELKGKIEDEDGALAKANDAYALAETKVATSDFNTFKTENSKAIADAVDAEKQRAEGIEGGLRTDVNDIKTNYAKTADVVTNEEFATFEEANTAAIADAKKAGTDANAALEAYKTTNDARIEVILNGTDADKVDSLNELIDWVDTHGGEVEQIKNDINSKVSQAAYDEHLTAQDTRDDGQDEKIAALEAKPGLDKVGTVTSVVAGEGLDGGTITESGTIALNAATKASLAKADTALQAADIANLATKGEVEAAQSAAEGKVTELANGAVKTNTEAIAAINDTENGILAQAKAYADANDADTTYTAKANGGLKLEGTEFRIDETMTFIFNCGSATTVLDAPNA